MTTSNPIPPERAKAESVALDSYFLAADAASGTKSSFAGSEEHYRAEARKELTWSAYRAEVARTEAGNVWARAKAPKVAGYYFYWKKGMGPAPAISWMLPMDIIDGDCWVGPRIDVPEPPQPNSDN